ncbi:F0F1 ATP synthase subunit B [Telmatospirillum sp. J64-1]|uniref:F0F1 ATP synthase subunit B family protein n=1 Tax=Telmatospirillum sp. J64-1 TaxID=2502183 RepID=UPI00115ED8AE|nr:F0F1 ATP synthase subunit B [Telmatospirillum sp. J64-1]
MISAAIAATPEQVTDHVAFYQAPEFWVLVSFLLVVGFAWRPVGRAIANALDNRAEGIRARIEEAVHLREEAQEMLATYQRKQRDAMKEAEEIVAHAKAEAERIAAQAAKDLDAAMLRRERQAMERIAQAEAAAAKEVRDRAIDIAMVATRQIIAQNLPADRAALLVDEAIKDLPSKLSVH